MAIIKNLKLHSLALLLSGPVDKHSKLAGHRDRGNRHVHGNTERGDPAEAAEDQCDRAEKFRRNDEDDQRRGKSSLGKAVDRAR